MFISGKMSKENIKMVTDISDRIWLTLNLFRGEISTEDYHFILFLLYKRKNSTINNIIEDKTNFDNLFKFKFDNSNEISFNKGKTPDQIIEDYYASIIKEIPITKLQEIINTINTIDERFFEANFIELFDALLYKYYNSLGRYSGESLLPKEISRFMINLANLKPNSSIYNPFAGPATLGVLAKKENIYIGQEINIKTRIIGMLRLLITNSFDTKYLLSSDSIDNWNPSNNKFDLIIASPPFVSRLPFDISGKWGTIRNFESFTIEKGLESLKQNGKLIIHVPDSFLFTSGQGANLRYHLIEEDLIESVISLPNGILQHTAIKTSILVLNKAKKSKGFINFIIADEFISEVNNRTKILQDLDFFEAIYQGKHNNFNKKVSINEIKSNQSVLSCQRYFIVDNFNGLRLNEISSYLKGSRIENIEIGRLVKIRNLSDSIVNFNLDITELEESEIPFVGITKIQQSCLLVALRWRTLKPTYFEYNGEPIYISNDILAFKVDKKNVNINYLINELHADYVVNQLDGLRLHSIIPILRKDDFFQIKIKLPSIEEQNKKYYSLADEYIKSKVKESEIEHKERRIDIEDENSFLRHQIAGSLKNIRGAFKFVQQIINEQVKNVVPVLDNLKADERLETTFSEYMNIIERDLASINKAVNKAGDKIDLLDLNIESFDLLEFIKDYVNSLKVRANNLFTVEIDLDDKAIIEYSISAINISGDKDIIRKMLDNIIENAERHAFTNSINNGNKIKIELIYDFENSSVQIDISNTGKALPENISFDILTRKGSTSGENSGNGLGLWFVNEVMKIHKGKFYFTDETGPDGIKGEYVTIMKLTFQITTVNDENI
jgi:type I restriction enzyme M protein